MSLLCKDECFTSCRRTIVLMYSIFQTLHVSSLLWPSHFDTTFGNALRSKIKGIKKAKVSDVFSCKFVSDQIWTLCGCYSDIVMRKCPLCNLHISGVQLCISNSLMLVLSQRLCGWERKSFETFIFDHLHWTLHFHASFSDLDVLLMWQCCKINEWMN